MISCIARRYRQQLLQNLIMNTVFFVRKLLGIRYGSVGTRFSLILGTRIGSLKHLKKPLMNIKWSK